ncbi:MAG: transposase [Bacteroidales bacterium]|nr:transposase [Bacteroidales bacterium]MBS3774403.1 transposase [Bacteroidales bacterium]
MRKQTWQPIDDNGEIAVCEFEYKAGPWKRYRTLKAFRMVKEYVEKKFFGEKQYILYIPVNEYGCYVSSYDDKDGWNLHKLYKVRSTSETWIEQVKSQLRAGQTLTDDFWANDILWQLNCFAYNISVMMRYKRKKFYRQEQRTFRDWFILVPGKLVKSGHQIEIKMYADYYYKYNWIEFDRLQEAA